MSEIYAPEAKRVVVNSWPRGYEAVSLGFFFGVGFVAAVCLMLLLGGLFVMAAA